MLRGTLLKVNEEIWRDNWDLNVFGYINLTREIYRSMRDRQSGVIMNVMGNSGLRPNANYIATSGANTALIHFTESLGKTSRRDGIRGVDVNPGPVTTRGSLSSARYRAKKFSTTNRAGRNCSPGCRMDVPHGP
ncbi:SDR family NAD(P)-dependent oxidoreductase [Alphaproteobacteria bacterium]|nr:SDR family NAD(P)-dependent oxidoreductase [Alphaproteobacteria bacterium]